MRLTQWELINVLEHALEDFEALAKSERTIEEVSGIIPEIKQAIERAKQRAKRDEN